MKVGLLIALLIKHLNTMHINNNNKSNTRGRAFRMLKFDHLLGTSIMFRHGTLLPTGVKEAPYEDISVKDKIVKLNRLAYVPLERAERIEGEHPSDHFKRDYKAFKAKLEATMKQFGDYSVYTLDKYLNTTRKIACKGN